MNEIFVDYPFVTVVMPVRNEVARIACSVGAVLRQDYPPGCLEIIVADGMSEDATIETISRLPGAERVTIIPNAQRLQASGLNRAIEQAHGDIIVRVDGHTVIAPNYVRTCVEILRARDAEGVGGSLNAVGHTAMGRAIAAAGKSPFAIPSVFRVSTKAQYTDTVYLGAWRRCVFDRIAGFDECLAVNEDYELNYRIRRAGGSIFYSPDLRSEYYGQDSLTALARQHFRYGYWKPRTLMKHPASLRPRQLAAPALVAFMVGVPLLSQSHAGLEGVWKLGILAYLCLTGLFSLLTARRNPSRAMCYLPLVFITIHLAWGSGFWLGVLRALMPRRAVT